MVILMSVNRKFIAVAAVFVCSKILIIISPYTVISYNPYHIIKYKSVYDIVLYIYLLYYLNLIMTICMYLEVF